MRALSAIGVRQLLRVGRRSDTQMGRLYTLRIQRWTTSEGLEWPFDLLYKNRSRFDHRYFCTGAASEVTNASNCDAARPR